MRNELPVGIWSQMTEDEKNELMCFSFNCGTNVHGVVSASSATIDKLLDYKIKMIDKYSNIMKYFPEYQYKAWAENIVLGKAWHKDTDEFMKPYIYYVEYNTVLRMKDENGIWRAIRFYQSGQLRSDEPKTHQQLRKEVFDRFLLLIYRSQLAYKLSERDQVDTLQISEEERLRINK